MPNKIERSTPAADASEALRNISGIVVTAEPARIDEVLAALSTLPGVEVTGCDRDRGRIAVVQEAEDVGAEVASFSRIRALPAVINADLVCHCFDGDAGDPGADGDPAPSPPARP